MAERVNILKTDYEMNRTDWTEVVSAVFGGMLRVQEAIEMYVAKGQAWNVDFHTKKIKIGKSTYPIQYIGSEAIESNDWLWGWENINGFWRKGRLCSLNKSKSSFDREGNRIYTFNDFMWHK